MKSQKEIVNPLVETILLVKFNGGIEVDKLTGFKCPPEAGPAQTIAKIIPSPYLLAEKINIMSVRIPNVNLKVEERRKENFTYANPIVKRSPNPDSLAALEM